MVVRIDFSGVNVRYPYFTVNIHNEYGDRVATISSTHTGKHLQLERSGFVECIIRDLRLGEGIYTMMLDYGFCMGTRDTFTSLDCVPTAIKFQVKLDEFVKGIGLDPFQGAAHRSDWRDVRE
jgi:lipopolysaccharide transport system ATP-binding protein